jgi:hypothetical protein
MYLAVFIAIIFSVNGAPQINQHPGAIHYGDNYHGNKQSQPYQQDQQQMNSDVKTVVVTNKNGLKITTITESIIDKPSSDNSERPKKSWWENSVGEITKTTVVEVKNGTKITTITEGIITKPASDTEPPKAMSGNKTEVIKNSDGKPVVINKNGSKTTTITESIIDKPVSDNSEDLKCGTKVITTGDVVNFPSFPSWSDFGKPMGGPVHSTTQHQENGQQQYQQQYQYQQRGKRSPQIDIHGVHNGNLTYNDNRLIENVSFPPFPTWDDFGKSGNNIFSLMAKSNIFGLTVMIAKPNLLYPNLLEKNS